MGLIRRVSPSQLQESILILCGIPLLEGREANTSAGSSVNPLPQHQETAGSCQLPLSGTLQSCLKSCGPRHFHGRFQHSYYFLYCLSLGLFGRVFLCTCCSFPFLASTFLQCLLPVVISHQRLPERKEVQRLERKLSKTHPTLPSKVSDVLDFLVAIKR